MFCCINSPFYDSVLLKVVASHFQVVHKFNTKAFIRLNEAFTFYVLKGKSHCDIILLLKNTCSGYYSRPELRNIRGDCDHVIVFPTYSASHSNSGCSPWNCWSYRSSVLLGRQRVWVKHLRFRIRSVFLFSQNQHLNFLVEALLEVQILVDITWSLKLAKSEYETWIPPTSTWQFSLFVEP